MKDFSLAVARLDAMYRAPTGRGSTFPPDAPPKFRQAPFPYFGGKRTVAAEVWRRLGRACHARPALHLGVEK